MYKIMLLVRDSETKPLWTFYTESGAVFGSDDMDTIEEKIKELLNSYTCKQVRVIQDMSYTLDVLFE